MRKFYLYTEGRILVGKMVRTWIRGGKVLANVYPVDLVHSTKVAYSSIDARSICYKYEFNNEIIQTW